MNTQSQVAGRQHAPEDLSAGDSQPARADLFHALRSRAERMSLRTLERRGFRNVQVLDMATIERVVAESLTHMVERRTAVTSVEDRSRLEAEAKKEFAQVLAEHQGESQKTESVRQREGFERQIQGLRAELDRQTSLLQSAQSKTDGTALRLSPESFQKMEEKIRALFAHLVSGERRISLAEGGPRAVAGLTELEREVAAFLDRLLEGERERFIGAVRHDQDETVENLEKRILKLNKALAGTEDQLRRMAEMKAGDPGIASIYESIQGLSPFEANFEKKKEILEIIFKENLAIRMNRPSRLAGAEAANPARKGAPLVIPARFEAPLEQVAEEVAL